jgi:hypothetical protein
VRDRKPEARFAHAAWTSESEQAHVGSTEQGRELGEFLLASKQWGQWQREAA